MCFTGHRKLNEPQQVIAQRLDAVLEVLYGLGYRRFMNGGALGFDLLAAERVLLLQAAHPDVHLVMCIPCEGQTRHWSKEQIERRERILFQADESRILSNHYFNGCMMVRNRHMVDRSSCCVCYMDQIKGGTVSTVSYAINKGLKMLNIAIPDLCDTFIQAETLE